MQAQVALARQAAPAKEAMPAIARAPLAVGTRGAALAWAWEQLAMVTASPAEAAPEGVSAEAAEVEAMADGVVAVESELAPYSREPQLHLMRR